MPFLHVPLSEELYRELIRTKLDLRCRTWVEFFEKIVLGEIEIQVKIMSVDDEPPESHTVEFTLGEFRYIWDGQDCVLVDEPSTKTVRATTLRAM